MFALDTDGGSILKYVSECACGGSGGRARNVAPPPDADVSALLDALTSTTSECAEDVAHEAGTPCATNKILKTVAAFAAAAPSAQAPAPSPLLPDANTPAATTIRTAAAALGCPSESCVLTHPNFRAFARNAGVSGRELDLELELRFKAQGPRDSLALLSNFNLDGTMQRWARVFTEFYPCPFAMMDFDRNGDLFGEIDMCAVLDGRVPMDLGPGIGRLTRPSTCFGCIINTDVSTNKGKHWMAVFVDCRSEAAPWSVEFFNSVGGAPMRPITVWLERTRARLAERHATEAVAVTDIDHQESQTECGLYALYYVRRRLEGTPYSFFSEKLVPDAAMTAFRQHVFRAA